MSELNFNEGRPQIRQSTVHQFGRVCFAGVSYSKPGQQGRRFAQPNFEGAEMSAEQHAAKKINRQSATLPGPIAAAVQATLEDWRVNRKVQRLWERDASLWSGSDEQNWLGWLDIVDHQLAHLDHLKAIAAGAQSAGFSNALLLGMGGSRLCPAV